MCPTVLLHRPTATQHGQRASVGVSFDGNAIEDTDNVDESEEEKRFCESENFASSRFDVGPNVR